MKYNKYKKLIYLLGLTSMLTLNGCKNDKNTDATEVTEITDTTKNNCNHLDEDSLDIKTLSNGTKYVTDASVFYAIRERFLNNNTFLNFDEIELNDNDYNELLNNSEYLYLYDNEQIRKHLTYYMMGLKNMYPELEMSEIMKESYFYCENHKGVNIGVKYELTDRVEYDFYVDSYFSDYEKIDYDITSDLITFSKYMLNDKFGEDEYSIIEQYSLVSVEKDGLDRITIAIKLQYDLDKSAIVNDNCCCNDCEAQITLNNGEDSLEINLTEKQFEIFASLLTNSARELKTVAQFLEENESLMTEIGGEEYTLFLEKTNAITYTLKKPVQ